MQPTPKPQEVKGDPKSASSLSAIRLIENDKVQQALDLARDYIAGKSWKNAVEALQAILDGREEFKGDFYVQVKRFDPVSGENKVRWASAKYEANALLGSMSPQGLEVYEVEYGSKARELLTEAKKKGDREILADVAQRYMHTKAGAEANDLLATTFLDRGQFFSAALRFERLLNLKESQYKPGDLTLFKAAFAYRRAGDVKNADRLWQRLEPRLRRAGGLRIGDELVTTARLRDVLDRIPPPPDVNPHDWVMVGGNLTRSAQAKGSPPLLDEVLWSRKTVMDKNDETGEVDRGQEARTWIDNAVLESRRTGQPVMPGMFPIAAGGKVIYRTYRGMTAVNVHELRDNDGKVIAKPGDIEWKATDFEASLAVLLSDLKMSGTVTTWLNSVYRPSFFTNLVYENSAVGTVSTDHRLAYAIDDLAVPAPPTYLQQHIWNTPQVDDKIKPLVNGNSLQAFELETGRIAFRIGGGESDNVETDRPDKEKVKFTESHFLGVPVSVGGKLYVLNEMNDGKLRLITLEVRAEARPEGHTKYRPVVITPVQELGTVAAHNRVKYDISRRSTTVHLAYGEGILVCPTNAGEMLGVDLTSRTLAWAYPYRQTAPNPMSLVQTDPRFGFQPPNRQMALSYANWKVAPPVIADGKVVFTAPDAVAVHCINLRDGTPVWTARQQDHDLFFAGVYDGKVLIVGKNSVRAHSLANGERLWSVPTDDMPSGQGVASKNVYYLPLSKGEILAIDVATGKAHHNRSAVAGKAPGNLIFYEGAVLSQTVDEIVAYPQLTAKLELASKAVTADPNNLEKRALRGELLLRDGRTQDAIDDLRAVWQKKPQGELGKRVRQQLYEALTDLMHSDFKTARAKYLNEYRALCQVPGDPAEQEHREAKLLRILGQGLESEGDLVGAFKAYREFGSLPLHRSEGVPSLEDPAQKIPSNVWLRGRVMNMLAKAAPEQRRPLEAKIAEEWKAVEAKNDLEAVRSFVGMFDVPFRIGREARLKLADLVIEKRDQPAYLEAELDLRQLLTPSLKDGQVRGRALDALARLEIGKGNAASMKLALQYYQQLAAEYPQAVVRDGKTGAQLYKDLSNDKRFLAYLADSEARWPAGDIRYRELPADPNMQALRGFVFEPRGDVPPFLAQTRLLLEAPDRQNATLRILDAATNQIRGGPIALGNVPLNVSFFNYLYNQAQNNFAYYPEARFRFFHAKGHLAVVQVGTVAYALDLSAGKLLWQHNLIELNPGQAQPNFGNPQVSPDAEGNIWIIITDRPGMPGGSRRVRVGSVAAVEASYVALTTHKGLVLLDPLRGTPLWGRLGVRPHAEVFGDSEHLYLVHGDSSGLTGPSEVLRVSDGTPVQAKSFTYLYKHRIRVTGRNLLAADPAGGQLTLRLYDVLTGNDLWKKSYDARAVVLQTFDPYLTGVIEPSGKVNAVDLHTYKEVLSADALQYKVKENENDLKNLHKPLLLADGERFYVALNTPVDTTKVSGAVLANNFFSGLRCAPVNGWFCAFNRKGEFLWHVEGRLSNQMIVLEQFAKLPVLLFSVRYWENQRAAGPGAPVGLRAVSFTVAVNKDTGSVIYGPPEPRVNNMIAQFYALRVDPKAATVNLYGDNGVLQFYVNDGRKRPEDALLNGFKGGQRGVGSPLQPGGYSGSKEGMPVLPKGLLQPAPPPPRDVPRRQLRGELPANPAPAVERRIIRRAE
jgi:outer membrane protein assembly factor BamB